MNDSTVKFVTDWLDRHNVKYEVLKDLSIKIFMAMGYPRKKTYIGKFGDHNVFLECTSDHTASMPHYFFLILNVPLPYDSRIEG